MAQYTIGALARAADVPASTLRYYERIRLIRAAGRTEGNYRLFDDATLERVRFIRAAQSSGLTLEDIAELLTLRDGEAAPCREVEELLERRLKDVECQLATLRSVRAQLKTLRALCQASTDSGRCETLQTLQASAARNV